MKGKILAVLKQKNDYVSGQELCEILGVSRTAVWKVMNQLKEEGYTIEAVPNKGYTLYSCPNQVTEYAILSELSGRDWLGGEIRYVEEVDSTNTLAKQIANSEPIANVTVVADTQYGGRGRRGRAWTSPRGSSISLSCMLRPQIAPEHASRLTLITAMAVVAAIREVTGLEAGIKWPNDVIVHGKKVCGILTEMSSEMDYIHYVVIGIGINVNITEFPEEISDIATSLRLETNTEISRAKLIASILEEMNRYYKVFLKTEDLQELTEEYNSSLVHLGQKIQIINAAETTQAVALGILPNGSLLVELQDGTRKEIISGEVSIRGQQGYV